jgi:pimeloyl-ACP methyl ester carboxylesterase
MSYWCDTLGMSTRQVDVGGISTRIQSGGLGAPLLLLHGRGGHLETWIRNSPALAERFQVFAIDLLGHGLTDRPADSRFDIGSLTRHVRDVLDTLALPAVHIVGQSLGGWVAAELALTEPDRVNRLALIEPAGLMSEAERLADPVVADKYKTGGAAYDHPSLEAVRARLAGLLQDPSTLDDEMVNVRWRLYQPAEARDVHKQVRKADNTSWLLTLDRLRTLRPRTLFLRGEDGHTPQSIVDQAIAASPDARGLTVHGARQWPQYEQAGVVNAALINHFI